MQKNLGIAPFNLQNVIQGALQSWKHQHETFEYFTRISKKIHPLSESSSDDRALGQLPLEETNVLMVAQHLLLQEFQEKQMLLMK